VEISTYLTNALCLPKTRRMCEFLCSKVESLDTVPLCGGCGESLVIFGHLGDFLEDLDFENADAMLDSLRSHYSHRLPSLESQRDLLPYMFPTVGMRKRSRRTRKQGITFAPWFKDGTPFVLGRELRVPSALTVVDHNDCAHAIEAIPSPEARRTQDEH